MLKLAYQNIQLPCFCILSRACNIKLKTKVICVSASFSASFLFLFCFEFIAFLRRAIAQQGQGLNIEAKEDLSQVLAIEPNNKRAKVLFFFYFFFFFAGSTILC